ncbi:MAG: hypothetical protein KDK38_11210, partial [Leptospiraceae bacterium]|nr:hypothetical protein [Leptospiraceae bacterium]
MRSIKIKLMSIWLMITGKIDADSIYALFNLTGLIELTQKTGKPAGTHWTAENKFTGEKLQVLSLWACIGENNPVNRIQELREEITKLEN